ncbi:MAG TPA: GGDEF domain-containing protein, partial [Burkholderiales bacterium]
MMPALDPLTWLPNQQLFRARLASVLAGTQGARLALLHVDLDRFRDVNELLGWDTGDLLLRETAARMARALPRGAMLGHLGGDDFAALVEAPEPQHAVRLGRALLDACREPFLIDCLSLRVTASVGIGFSCRLRNAADLIENACYCL